jgi:hypothetical protein
VDRVTANPALRRGHASPARVKQRVITFSAAWPGPCGPARLSHGWPGRRFPAGWPQPGWPSPGMPPGCGNPVSEYRNNLARRRTPTRPAPRLRAPGSLETLRAMCSSRRCPWRQMRRARPGRSPVRACPVPDAGGPRREPDRPVPYPDCHQIGPLRLRHYRTPSSACCPRRMAPNRGLSQEVLS